MHTSELSIWLAKQPRAKRVRMIMDARKAVESEARIRRAAILETGKPQGHHYGLVEWLAEQEV